MPRSYGRFVIRSRHGSTFHFRIRIPADLRLHFGARVEIRRSLRTADWRCACLRAGDLRARCETIFSVLREAGLAKKTNPDELSLVGYQMFMDALGRKHEVDYPDDPDREERQIQALREKDDEFVRTYPDVVAKLRGAAVQEPTVTAVPFSQVADEYLEDYAKRGSGRRKKTPGTGTLTAETRIVAFWKIVFGETPIHEIGTTGVRNAQKLLDNLPANRVQLGLSDAEAINLAATSHGYKTLAGHNTAPKYAARLAKIFGYARKMRYILDDPSDVLDTAQDKSVGKDADPFTIDEVRKIFAGKRYIERLQVHRTENSERLLAAQFWMPLLAAFSGARAEELAQLTVRDLGYDAEAAVHYLDITNEGLAGDGRARKVKSGASKRWLPVHSTLQAIGFIDFVEERRRAEGDDAGLFLLTRSSDEGRLAKVITQWFSRSDAKSAFLRRCGLVTHLRDTDGKIVRSKTFHSWRHTVRDVLRQQPHPVHGGSIPEYEIDYVTGHAATGSAGVDYGEGERPLSLVASLVECIRYDGVPFGDITWQQHGT